jgi:hypothetical protein
MAYSNTGLKLVQSGTSGGPNMFVYSSTDVHTDVDASGYFSDGVTFGMKVGDVVIVQDTDTGTYNTTIHSVSAVSGTAATISAALLA